MINSSIPPSTGEEHPVPPPAVAQPAYPEHSLDENLAREIPHLALIHKPETQIRKTTLLAVAPLFLKELQWPLNWPSLPIKKIVIYELLSFFKRLQTLVPHLGFESHQAFVNVFNRFNERPTHDRNKKTLAFFIEKLKRELGPSAYELDSAEFKERYRTLQFFCSATEISNLTVGQIVVRVKENSDPTKLDWEHAHYSWDYFGIFLQSLLTVMKNGLDIADQNLSKIDILKTPLDRAKFNKSNPFSKKIGESCHAIEKIFSQIQPIKMIIASRSQLWQSHYTSLLHAFQLPDSQFRNIYPYVLKHLQSNIELLIKQITHFQEQIGDTHQSFTFIFTPDELKKMNKETEESHYSFMRDEVTDEELQQFVVAQHQSLRNEPLPGDLSKAIALMNPLAPTHDDVKRMQAVANQHYAQHPPKNEKEREERDFSQKILEMSMAFSQRSNDKVRGQAKKQSETLLKQANLKPNQEKEFKFRLHFTYKILLTVEYDLKYCLHSLETFQSELKAFEQLFSTLKVDQKELDRLEKERLLIQDELEQQEILEKMAREVATPTLDLAVEEDNIEEEGESETITLTISSPTVPMLSSQTHLQQFYHLPFFKSACQALWKNISLVPFKKRIVRTMYEDIHLHTSLLGCSLDLVRRIVQDKTEELFLAPTVRMIIRSLAIITEQQLSAELLLQNDPDATSNHSHMMMAKSLQRYGQTFSDSDLQDLKNLDHGVVTHRYPHSSKHYFTDQLPLTLKWLVGDETLNIEQIKDLIQFVFGFLNRYHPLEPTQVAKIQNSIRTAFYLTKEEKTKEPSQISLGGIVKPLHSLNNKLQFACEGSSHEKRELLLNLQYHCLGLSESLECFSLYSDACYLLPLGDSILMHLQHLDELMEDYLYFQGHGRRLGDHDLERYRQLRGHQDTPTEAAVISSLNCGSFGDHYPHRYRLMLPFTTEGKKSLPTAVIWRLDALRISLQGDDVDAGLTPVAVTNDNKQFKTADSLRIYLLKTSEQIIQMTNKRFTLS